MPSLFKSMSQLLGWLCQLDMYNNLKQNQQNEYYIIDYCQKI